MVLPSEFQPTFRSRFPASAETGFHQLRGTLGPGCIRGSPLGAHFRTDRPALPGLMSGSASAGVAVRASSPDQGAFRRRFVGALATQETRISGTSFAATHRPRFERPFGPSRRLSSKNHRNPFYRSGPPSSASQPEKQPQPLLSNAATLPSLAFTKSVALSSGVHPGPRPMGDFQAGFPVWRFRTASRSFATIPLREPPPPILRLKHPSLQLALKDFDRGRRRPYEPSFPPAFLSVRRRLIGAGR